MVDDEHLYKYKTRGENISRDSRDSEKKKSRASRKSRQVLEQQQLLWTAARESYVAEKWEEEWAKRIPADAREDGWRFYYFWSPSFFLYILLVTTSWKRMPTTKTQDLNYVQETSKTSKNL